MALPIAAAEGLKATGNVARRHWRGIAAFVGGSVLTVGALGGLDGCESKPVLQVEEEVNATTSYEMRRLAGKKELCFVEQTGDLNVKADHEEYNVTVSVPSFVPFVGGKDIIEKWELGTRTSEKTVAGMSEMCANPQDLEVLGNFNLETGVPEELTVNINRLFIKDSIDAAGSKSKPVAFAAIDILPGMNYDNEEIMDLIDVVGQRTIGSYACRSLMNQVATTEAKSMMESFAWDIGRIPPEKVTVNVNGMPYAEEQLTAGPISQEDLYNKLKISVPDNIHVTLGETNCGAFAIDSAGEVLPTWEWETA